MTLKDKLLKTQELFLVWM